MQVVGIDLGTTHTVVAHADRTVRIFEVPQLVSAREVMPRPLLPSFLYAPLEGEMDERFLLDDRWIAGEHARARASEVVGRSVSSAKSWLSYSGVDRRAAILPWRLAGDPAEDEGDEALPRISPVAASALILRHVERAWNEAHPNAPLAKQEVVLTVPASFDAVARELTVEAARTIGLELRLLEEPQAAFYDLLRLAGDALLEELLGDDDEALVLVCDVGGGTTDLSLIRIRRSLDIDRVAVGRHLLLGGDNMDLALAHRCEQRLGRLEPRQFAALVGACRAAKERLLSDEPPDEVPIAVARSGSQLVGGTARTNLSRAEVEESIVEGFFPDIALDEVVFAARGGIVAFGLPYEREVGITRHLAAFLNKNRESGLPKALLLNGGVFRARAIVERIERVVARWTDGRVRRLALTDPDTSVALGACAYGLALRGRGRRIGGGAAKSFYLGLSADQALCVLPRGVEEGDKKTIDAHALALTVGRRVRFDLYASDVTDDAAAIVTLDDRHERLAPLATTIDSYGEGEQRIGVVLEAELGAVGTLELACLAESGRRYRLAFDLREDRPAHESASATARYGKRLDEARAAIERIYGKKARKDVAAKEVKGLARELERILQKRDKWDATLARTLFDTLFRHHRGRRVSADHERMFWMLAGYCLRPGVGHARDSERVAELFGLFEERLAHPGEVRSWAQFWIAWRRVAAGLDEKAQARVRDVIDPFLAPTERGLKKHKPFKNDALWEMLELAAGLERAPAARRGELGGWILERTWTERDARLWSALGKVGARVPVYGSAHHVVSARSVERWMDHLLREKWDAIPTAPRAAVAMCRLTGDRDRDLSERTREQVAARLQKIGVPEALILPVRELVPLDAADRADFYGDDLPLGLSLSAVPG